MATVRCPSCDAENDPQTSGWAYCEKCGKALSARGSAAAAASAAITTSAQRGLWAGAITGVAVSALLLAGPLRGAGYLLQFALGFGVLFVTILLGRELGRLMAGDQE